MKVLGKIIKLMGRGFLYMFMEINMMECGKMTRHMELENILMPTVHTMTVNGNMICNMEQA